MISHPKTYNTSLYTTILNIDEYCNHMINPVQRVIVDTLSEVEYAYIKHPLLIISIKMVIALNIFFILYSILSTCIGLCIKLLIVYSLYKLYMLMAAHDNK